MIPRIKWKQLDGDIDYRSFVRTISIKPTKANYKRIDRYCRRKSYRTHCGCEHDCCGHLSSMYTTADWSQDSVTITQTYLYNY